MLQKVDRPKQKKAAENDELIKDDLDFTDWYNGLENDLLEASHEEYTYVRPQLEEESYMGLF